jgi:predicted alpha/beta hydrolase
MTAPEPLSSAPLRPSTEAEAQATSFVATAADGYAIHGLVWRHHACAPNRPVVIINPATSVRCRYYFRFAAYLYRHGFDVIAFDYRGIGLSRPPRLRGFAASWLTWGADDLDAVLCYAGASFPDQPIHIVAHSFGGVAVGLAPSNHRIARIFTVGAQYAYWRDYAPEQRLGMVARWHIAMPLLTLAYGYFPGTRLGWLEDTPKGVVRDWALSRARFEETWRGRSPLCTLDPETLRQRFAAVTAPILALGISDDEFGTIPAIERLLGYFAQSARTHWRIAPRDIGAEAIGHFAFFHSRFERSLWPAALAWLRTGEITPGFPGRLISATPPQPV